MQPADIRAMRIADTQLGIHAATRAGEHSMATALTSQLNHLLAESLEAGD